MQRLRIFQVDSRLARLLSQEYLADAIASARCALDWQLSVQAGV